MILILCTLVLSANAHDWGFGPCPKVRPYPNLSIPKFLGEWYVVEQHATSSKCITLNFTKLSEASLSVTKTRQFPILESAGVDHSSSYEGTLDIPSEFDQGRMRARWPLNPAGKSDFIVFDTDYVNYAGIYDCQEITSFMYRESAAILSRFPKLDQIYVNRVKRRMNSMNIPSEDLDPVNQSDCIKDRKDPEVNLNFKPSTIPAMYDDALTFVRNAANTTGEIVNEVADAASSVVESALNETRSLTRMLQKILNF